MKINKKSTNDSKSKTACTAKMGEKGQIVIPKEIRDMFDLHPGDTMIILADKKRGIGIPPKSFFNEIISKILETNEEE